jgi:trk system potassium uptake protein TrkA
MEIIIAGAGEVGTHLAKLLSKEKHNITIIDRDSTKIKQVIAHHDIMGVVDNAISFDVLKRVGIKTADLFIAVTENEETNITASILAKELGVKKTIARVDNNEFLLKKNKGIIAKLGIDSLIYPQKLAAEEIIKLLKQTGTTETFEFSKGHLSFYTIKLEKDAPIVNKKLKDITNEKQEFDYRAVAIYRNSKTIIPNGNDVFKVNDLIYVISNKTGVSSLMQSTGKKKIDIKNVMILGGSRIGKKTAKELQKKMNVKLIERSEKKCIELADYLTDTLVLNGDGSDTELLLEEGIKKMDAFIAVTDNSETNILSCLLAKRFGVKKTIAEIENIDFIDLAEDIGIDTIINKKLLAASKIYGYTISAEVSTVKCVTGTDAEVLEFVAHEGSKIINKPLSEIDFPDNAIIGGVTKGNNSYIAKGDTIIEVNDKVVVFTLPKAIHKLEQYFQ